MITIFGATGFTGQLTARALARANLPFRIAGRSAEKLAALSASLPGCPPWVVADAAQSATLPGLFQDTTLLINLAGPFTDLGERVIAQAAIRGVHYLDVTNELGYAFRARTYDQMARRSKAALVPACGFEVTLADCAAQLAGSRLLAGRASNPLDEVNVVYDLKGQGASAGTRRSAVRSLATSWIAYRDGEWIGQIPSGRVRRFAWLDETHHALNFPSCESVTVPAHTPTHRVDVWMANARGARFWAPLAIPLFARLSRGILRRAIPGLAACGALPTFGALDADRHGSATFTIYVEARRAEKQASLILKGRNPYALTAEILAYTARRLTDPTYRRSGLLSPAQAFGAQDLLGYAKEHWELQIQS
jgi:short subunit dehydrogenase-like uncharacterized protein